MLIAHDLLLLLLDDESGRIPMGMPVPDKALAGAVLVDLAARGLVDVANKGRLAVRSGPQPSEHVLRGGLAVLCDQEGAKPQSVLGPLAKGLRDQLAEDLVARGILRREERKILGFFRVDRLPANDNMHEAELRATLSAVLRGAPPDVHTGALISLLHAMGAVTSVLSVDDRRAAKRRAKQIAQGDWAADAVRKAVQAAQQAVVAAVVAANSGYGSS